MKKKNLKLKKEIISNLAKNEMNDVKGGVTGGSCAKTMDDSCDPNVLCTPTFYKTCNG